PRSVPRGSGGSARGCRSPPSRRSPGCHGSDRPRRRTGSPFGPRAPCSRDVDPASRSRPARGGSCRWAPDGRARPARGGERSSTPRWRPDLPGIRGGSRSSCQDGTQKRYENSRPSRHRMKWRSKRRRAMPNVESHAPGNFCWVELGTTDQAAAKKFYQTLFGWDSTDQPTGPDETYTMFKKGGQDVAAGYRLRPDQKGVPPNWQVYVSVASADDAVAKAKDLGAKVLAPPFDVFDAGRMAVVQDPTGAVFAVWEAKRNKGLGVIDEPGAFCWAELMARDLPRATTFYKSLFGWGTKGDPRYTEWTLGGRSIGGMMAIQKEWGD